MRAWRDLSCHLCQVQVHRCCIASRQDESRTFALLGADRTEDIGRGGALVLRRRRPRAALGPSARDLVLLPDPGFVAEPNLYCGRSDALGPRDFVQDGRELFLKFSMAPSA